MTVAPDPLAPAAATTMRRRQRVRLTAFGWFGAAILAVWTVVALVGPWVLPPGENALPFPDAYQSFLPPQPEAWLGTDVQERDMLTRIVYGAGRTLGIAALATTLAFLAGTVVGVGSALVGGWTDLPVARANDAIFSLPTVMLGLIGIAAFGSSIPTLIGVTGFLFAPIVFRLSRALAMEVMTQDFVEAVRRGAVVDHPGRDLAQHPVAAAVGIRAAADLCDPLDLLAQLPRPWHPAAARRLGIHGAREPRRASVRRLGLAGAGARHRQSDGGHQFPRR